MLLEIISDPDIVIILSGIGFIVGWNIGKWAARRGK